MTAKEMFLEKDCQWQETSWGIWIDTNASCSCCERLCMIDKNKKKIIWQKNSNEIELDTEMVKALCKLIEELGWEVVDENN